MATVNYWLGTWVSADEVGLGPGETHSWIAWGFFNYGDAISISAHPVVLAGVDRQLAVENVSVEGNDSGRRVFYTVRNVGSSSVIAYGVGYGAIGA
jgi:hypothetical protein